LRHHEKKLKAPFMSFNPAADIDSKGTSRMICFCKQRMHTVILFLKFFRLFNGMVVIAKLPHSEHEKTGYYHRVIAIDNILADIPVVYADWNSSPEEANIAYDFTSPKKNTRIVYKVTRHWYKLVALLCIIRCRKVYFHHVASIFSIFKLIVRLPFIMSFIDFHGAAPEEHELAGLHGKVAAMIKLEQFALTHIQHCIVVTKAMQNHLIIKYKKEKIEKKFIILPIIQSAGQLFFKERPKNGKYTVVYAGNTECWQQIPQMSKLIEKTIDVYNYKLYSTNPEAMNALLPQNLLPSVHAVAIKHDALVKIYASCDFGFALREDSIVNRVACPTKLVEYLAYGIVPILNSPNIGDFIELGMHYVTADMLEKRMLPVEKIRREMAEANHRVFYTLQSIYNSSRIKLQKLIINTNC